jgi:hypothetical protein
MIDNDKKNRYWAWGGGAAVIVLVAIVLWLSGAFAPNAVQ